MDFNDLKKPPFEKICVNGRVPAIEDPNTGITLWESAAIIDYLVETYDKEKKLTFTTIPEKFLVSQWIYFQMSGQGPYFGQAVWFHKYHQEQLESAKTRYEEQIKRVFYVLNKALEGKQYLVGDKWYVNPLHLFKLAMRWVLANERNSTIADLSFLTWDMLVPFIFGDRMASLDIENNYPNYFAWNKKLMERPSVKKIVKDKTAANS